jgi:hypothetical protein
LEELSQAWEYLQSLPEYDADVHLPWNPPQNLQRLSLLDWELLSHLLAKELLHLNHSHVH